MERLTIMIDNGLNEVYFENPADPEGAYTITDLTNADMEKIARRLAEYENTGLTPEGVKDIGVKLDERNEYKKALGLACKLLAQKVGDWPPNMSEIEIYDNETQAWEHHFIKQAQNK